MSSKNLYQYAATCSGGMESLLGEELQSFDPRDVHLGKNVVHFTGDLTCGYTACLWSRFASRILMEIATFPCKDEDELYTFCLHYDWSLHMDVQNTFAVDCSLGKTTIQHSRFAALRVKDGLVDFFRNRTGSRPSVQLRRPDARYHIHVDGGNGFLSVDLSGESLHRRGYRIDGGAAPLKESLAAAIVSLAGFHQDIEPDQSFVDPMCGSATLLIEAALIYGDSAPGLSRSYFGFNGWKGHNPPLWSKLIDQAISREETGLDKQWPQFIGYDADPKIVAIARQNIEKAGLTDRIRVKQAQLNSLHKPTSRGFLVTNPPYGERLLEKNETACLYSFLGRRLKEDFKNWNSAILLSNTELSEKLRIHFPKRDRLFNGPIACILLSGQVTANKPEIQAQWHISPRSSNAQADPFSDRLRKNLKSTLKWSEKKQINCFRVYDRDLPDFNLSIDLYGKWVLVNENKPPKTIDNELADNRFRHALASIREILDIPRSRIFIKKGRPQKTKKQAGKQKKKGKTLEVLEGNCCFLINLSDPPQTGLNLDERLIHSNIVSQSKGKRFLNLFCSTGTATVQAAVGGAVSTTSVDPSGSDLDWCRQNLALNGFSHSFHETIAQDGLSWLRQTTTMFDLIYIRPEKISTPRKDKAGFHLQQDHGKLITLAMKHLSPKGLLIFACRSRKFVLDPTLHENFQINDISNKTLPDDFKRYSALHRCWEIQAKR